MARKLQTDTRPLYGSEQSRFARYLERREQRRPDEVAHGLRRRLLAGLRGRVIEVGAGDGRSFEHYRTQVTELVAVEPDAEARAAAGERARSASIPIDVLDGVADALPAEDGAFNAAVVMGVLCSVPDPASALQELRRVVKPGGELRFWEHVRSEHALFRLVQHSFDKLFWTRSLGGCETTRDTEAAIREAGFEVVALDRGFHSSSFLTITSAPYVLGVARR
jgi:ubiquinone/menaquinone biosynthesis C-methylase UbiE